MSGTILRRHKGDCQTAKRLRQESAFGRFRIMPISAWAEHYGADMLANGITPEMVAEYDTYLAAKNVELNRLKHALNVK